MNPLPRRTFLGAAAAVAALTGGAAASDDDPDAEVTEGDYGGGRAVVESGAPVWSDIEIPPMADEQTDIRVAGHFSEYDAPTVDVTISQDHGIVELSMSPERARELATELRVAATNAEQGDAVAGGEGSD